SPRAERNLSAFQGAGLWLAVRMIPPAARRCPTASWGVGVVARPRSITSRPAALSPAATASRTMAPEGRASRPTATGPGGSPAAKAAANSTSTGGVSDSPTTPRTPATEIIREPDIEARRALIGGPLLPMDQAVHREAPRAGEEQRHERDQVDEGQL